MHAPKMLHVWLAFATALAVGWGARDLLGTSWRSLQAGSSPPPTSPSTLDSSLFETPAMVIAPQAVASEDSVLLGWLRDHGSRLGIGRADVQPVRLATGEDAPLLSLDLRRGVPLAERGLLLLEAFEIQGWRAEVSQERPRARWPWAARLVRDGRVILLRARVSRDPAPGTFGLRLLLWADSLPTDWLGRLESLPEGSVIALPAPLLSEARLRSEASRSGVGLALLVRLETSIKPVAHQRAERLLVGMDPAEVAWRIESPPLPPPAPEGVLVLHGERGAADPDLCVALAHAALPRSLWLVDATSARDSRLDSSFNAVGLAAIRRPLALEMTSDTILARAWAQAEAMGHSVALLPLESSTFDLLERQLPLMQTQGLSVVRFPSPVLDTSEIAEEIDPWSNWE